MSARFIIPSILIGALTAFAPAIALSQDVVQTPQVDNSRFHYEGAVNAGSVYVRSGPGDGYYATQMLSKGASVVVVGIKFDWLKVEPPDGSFSYVGKAFVDLQADGKVGRVNRNDVNVRAGSDLNALKTTVQARLNQGDTVQVLGTEDEYFKIKPPQGAYVYINKQFVDAVRAIADAAAPGTDSATQPSLAAQVAQGATSQTPTGPTITETPTTKPAVASIGGSAQAPLAEPQPQKASQAQVSAATNPSPIASNTSTTQPTAVASATTQPAVPQLSAVDKFAKFESQFDTMSKQTLMDQDVASLSAEYKTIANATDLSDELRRVVELRVATLDARADSQAKIAEVRKMEKDAAEKELAVKAEQDELTAKLEQSKIQIYTAVGTLQPSSLQLGGATIYRLVDPATGRTVIYLRTSDAKAATYMGQFVGVQGTPATDTQLPLRVIAPTAIATVDPAKVGGSVAAEIAPPSLLAKQASASTNGN